MTLQSIKIHETDFNKKMTNFLHEIKFINIKGTIYHIFYDITLDRCESCDCLIPKELYNDKKNDRCINDCKRSICEICGDRRQRIKKDHDWNSNYYYYCQNGCDKKDEGEEKNGEKNQNK